MSHTLFYALYLSGADYSDKAVLRFLSTQERYRDCPYLFFPMPYVPPYQDPRQFSAIREFQRAGRYHPFSDLAQRRKLAIIDLSEWLGHENEEYLEVFLKFLHDNTHASFFYFEYVFTVGSASREQCLPLRQLLARYLGREFLLEDNTFRSQKSLRTLLRSRYPLDAAVAGRLTQIFAAHPTNDLAQVDTVMEALLDGLALPPGRKLTEPLLAKKLDALKDSILCLLYEKEVAEWTEELNVRYNETKGAIA